jgi:(p)ppGpp synthase/HD superfamily hydrolase
VLGPRFDQGLLYATAAHRQQPRKGTAVPYMSHLLGVASIVLTYGGTENQAISGLLHDTVEDCGIEHEPVIGELFGPEVLGIVLACTDARVPAGEAKGSWRDRKERYLRHLRELPPGDPALLVSCADKLHNAQAILADLEAIGPELWDRFPGRTPEDHLWYYGELAATFEALFPGPLADRLRSTVEAIGDVHRRLTGAATAGPERGT